MLLPPPLPPQPPPPPLLQGPLCHCQPGLDGTRGWRLKAARRAMTAVCPASASAKTMPPGLPKSGQQPQSE